MACASARWCAGATFSTTGGWRPRIRCCKEAVSHVAHYQIRNRGTVGGSLAHADPASEMPGIAQTCDAEIAVTGKAGARTIKAADFFKGALTTALEPDEIITEVHLPAWPAARRYGFQEFARRRGDFAMAGVALYYDTDGGKAANAHVGVFGVGDCQRRLPKAEARSTAIRSTRRSPSRSARRLPPRSSRRRTSTPAPPTGARSPARSPSARSKPRRRGRHMTTKFEVNGKQVSVDVEPRLTLADCLRHELRLTGTHIGCEHGVCGACTVLVDGEAVRSCLILAVQAEGTKITTVEGLSNDADLTPLQKSFRKHHALQCGFCTPGFITTAHALLTEEPDCDADRVREVLSGNICRCTGYIGIVDAVLEARAAYKK